MKHFLPILLLVVVLSERTAAGDSLLAERLLVEGNRHYASGAYREALAKYRQAEQAGYISGALYYNMGNACYRLDEVGQAIRYYERASRLLPDRPEIAHNLTIARARTVDRISELPLPVWTRIYRWMEGRLDPDVLFYVGWLLFTIASVILAWHQVRRELPLWLRRSGVGVTGMAIVLMMFAWFFSFQTARPHRGVVVADQVRVFENPQTGTALQASIHEGLVVDYLEQRESWRQIRLPDGVTGWARSEAFADI